MDWVQSKIGFNRPQNIRQPESFLIDLLWQSEGSSLHENTTVTSSHKIAYTKESEQTGNLDTHNQPKIRPPIVSKDQVMNIGASNVLLTQSGNPDTLTHLFLESITTPRMKGRFNTATPIVPQITLFQNLAGLNNTAKPAHYCNTIEKIAYHGGHANQPFKKGAVARSYIESFGHFLNLNDTDPNHSTNIGYNHLIWYLAEATSSEAWSKYPELSKYLIQDKVIKKGNQIGVDNLWDITVHMRAEGKNVQDILNYLLEEHDIPEKDVLQPDQILPSPSPLPLSPVQETTCESSSCLSEYEYTPYKWFWEAWQKLTNISNGENNWNNQLTLRRWSDWSICLLRTGLFLAYLWEAKVYIRIHNALMEKQRGNSDNNNYSLQQLKRFLEEGPVSVQDPLITIQDPKIPMSQKDCAPYFTQLSAMSADAITQFRGAPQDEPHDGDLFTMIKEYFGKITSDPNLNNKLAQLKPLKSNITRGSNNNSAQNTRWFFRTAPLRREFASNSSQHADFYYMLRCDSRQRQYWFELGPEWLVVIASLSTNGPGQSCTLGDLQTNLNRMGIYIDRYILVKMLERTGLTSDSPDADEAIVIKSGF